MHRIERVGSAHEARRRSPGAAQRGDRPLRIRGILGLRVGIGGEPRPALRRLDILRVGAFVTRRAILVEHVAGRAAKAAILQPSLLPIFTTEQGHQFKHHLRPTLNCGEVVVHRHLLADDGIGNREEFSRRGIVADGHAAAALERADFAGADIGIQAITHSGANPIGHREDGIDTRVDAVEPLLVASTFPLGHPIARERKPVRPDADAAGKFWVLREHRLREAHRVVLHRGEIGGELRAHNVARALVGCQVIIRPPVRRLADACFLRTITPLHDVVPRTQALHRAEVIDIRLARVARLCLRHPKHIPAARAQKTGPYPERHSQLRVLPGVPAPVVIPDVLRVVITVDVVTKGPEAIPMTLVHLLLIKRQHGIKFILHGLFQGRRTVRQAPHSEYTRRVQICR